MKRMIRTGIALLTAAVMLLCMTGCEMMIRRSEGRTYAENFFSLIQQEKYVDAALLFHSSAATEAEELGLYFAALENQLGVDFSAELTFTGVSSYQSNTNPNEGFCTLDLRMQFGLRPVSAKVDLLRDSAGFGITNIQIAALSVE